ncbi:glycosyltransferase [Brevibacillus massiliensis]|uniref:glycosyltransferase n=1 Tax=Brevibacillus massiliensis TaxID=1118054 RepID=UPI0002F49B8A|nr:glycosyltransferase family 2 protein [Brevibacillus massiliensis]
MVSISLCMIVKNEQETLARCLETVKDLVDEIVIVDTGSTDRTKEIASRYTKKIYDFNWIDDFSAARNFSFAKATKDYIMWLDADDVLLPADREKLSRLKRQLDPAADAVTMEYDYAFDDQGNVTFKVKRTRLVKREKQFQWRGVVHEDLIVSGRVIETDIVVTHKQMHRFTDRNLKIFEKQLRDGKELTPQDLLNYAMELYHNQRFEQAKEYFLRFMEVENIDSDYKVLACNHLAECYNQLGDREREWEYLLKSFQYDIPRPEFCCRIALRMMDQKKDRQAVFWCKLALDLPVPERQQLTTFESCRTWLPHIYLSICYYRLGDYELSYQHTKTALTYRPNDEDLQHNLYVLEELIRQK